MRRPWITALGARAAAGTRSVRRIGPARDRAGAAAAVAGARSGETIKIGSLHPLSGAAAADGQQMDNGAKLAVDAINEAGGIESLDGAQLELVQRGHPGRAGGRAERGAAADPGGRRRARRHLPERGQPERGRGGRAQPGAVRHRRLQRRRDPASRATSTPSGSSRAPRSSARAARSTSPTCREARGRARAEGRDPARAGPVRHRDQGHLHRQGGGAGHGGRPGHQLRPGQCLRLHHPDHDGRGSRRRRADGGRLLPRRRPRGQRGRTPSSPSSTRCGAWRTAPTTCRSSPARWARPARASSTPTTTWT